jgi:hypothetical protein
MLQRIETSDVMKRATVFFDEHNNKCPTVEVKRKLKDCEQIINRRVGLIPEAVTTTFHTILTEYVHSYNRTCSIMPDGMYSMTDLPAMHTNCVRLAKYCRCTDRTVRNHIGRLRTLGMIETKFHGNKKAFELWISPKFLFEQVANGEAGSPQKTPTIALEGKNAKDFPHNSTHREIIGTEKGNADMLIMYGESIQGQKGRTDNHVEPLYDWLGQQGQNQTGGGPRLEKSEIVAQNDKNRRQKATDMLERWRQSWSPGMPKGLEPRFRDMLLNFWLYAWKVVYPNREFSKEKQEKAIVAIAAGVFNNFVDVKSDKDWLDYYQFQMAKLDKAGRYYDNHPDAYRPDPYAVFVPGKGYFDYENIKGFVGIDAWIKKDSIRHARNRQAYADKQSEKVKRCEALLRTARRDFEKLRQNMKPRKEVNGKNQIALFQYYNVIFAGMGKKWQETFCNQYLAQQAIDFEPPKYLKPKRQRQMADRNAGSRIPATVVYVQDWMSDGNGFYSE